VNSAMPRGETSSWSTALLMASTSDFQSLRQNWCALKSMSSSSVRRLQFAPCSVRPAQFPIVLAYSTDPVGNGFVASLARPGGNITGLSGSSDDTSPKQLELVATVVPNASRIGLLGNPTTTTYTDVRKGAQNAALKGRPNCSTGRSARSAGDRERIRCISQGNRAGFHRSRRYTY